MSSTSTIPPPALTETDFCNWVGQAAPGDTLEYHRGFLGIDIALGRFPPPSRRRCGQLARRAALGLRRRASCTSCSAATARATSATSRSGGRGRGSRAARSAGPSGRRASSPSWRRRRDRLPILRHLTQAELAERWRVSDAHARPLARRGQGAGLAEAERPHPLPRWRTCSPSSGCVSGALRSRWRRRDRRAPPTDSRPDRRPAAAASALAATTFGNAALRLLDNGYAAAADRARREAPGAQRAGRRCRSTCRRSSAGQAVPRPRRRPRTGRAGRRRHRHPRSRPRAPGRPAGRGRGSATR